MLQGFPPAQNGCHFHSRPEKFDSGKYSRPVFLPPYPPAPAPPAPVKFDLSAPVPAAPAIPAIFRTRAGNAVSPPPVTANPQSPHPHAPPDPLPPTALPAAARRTKLIPVTAAASRRRRVPCRTPPARCSPPPLEGTPNSPARASRRSG